MAKPETSFDESVFKPKDENLLRFGLHHYFPDQVEPVSAVYEELRQTDEIRGRQTELRGNLTFRTLSQLNSIVPWLHQYSAEFFDSLRPFKQADESWDEALLEADLTTGRVFRQLSSEQQAVFKMAKGKARTIYPYTSWYSGYDRAKAVSWELSRGQDPRLDGPNPWIKLLQFDRENILSVGFASVSEGDYFDYHEILAVDIPLLLAEQQKTLGCLVLREGGPSDNQFLYYHLAMRHGDISDKSLQPIPGYTPKLKRIFHWGG